MSAADIDPNKLIIKPDGSINVDVLEKVRREYSGRSFIRNMYAKALLLCLNTIAEKYYTGSKPGEVDRNKKLDPKVAHDINEQFSSLLRALEKSEDRDVEEHRKVLREQVEMFIKGNLRRLRELQHSRMSKRGLVDTHKDVMKILGAKLTDDETIIISEDPSFRDFMNDLDNAKKENFESGTRGVFLFAAKVMGMNFTDAVVGGAVAATQKIGAAAGAIKGKAADVVGVMHRRGKSGDVKGSEPKTDPEISGPIGVRPRDQDKMVTPHQQPAEYDPNQFKDSKRRTRDRRSVEQQYGVPIRRPSEVKQPPPLPERKLKDGVVKTSAAVPPPLSAAEMAKKRAEYVKQQSTTTAKPITHSGKAYGNVPLKNPMPAQKHPVEEKTEFQKIREKFEKKDSGGNPPPKTTGRISPNKDPM